MSKAVILTGLRANNDLHIGNYFGALLPLIDMANNHADDYEINLFVPDLHSFTTPIDHKQLQSQTMHNLRLFAAAGLPLDNPNIHIYRQSYVPAHSELAWILDCFTGMGEMSRMTQYKDKSGQRFGLQERMISDVVARTFEANGLKVLREVRLDNGRMADLVIEDANGDRQLIEIKSAAHEPSVGLFNYPVLMAADILLYDASYVPVGDDQSQHLEFTRDIAERMNNRFGDLFTVPKPVREQHAFFGSGRTQTEGVHQGLRIKDLVDPTKKMSKSDDTGKGVIFLGDSPEGAAKKIMSATTDNEGVVHLDFDRQPGISNLLQIYALLSGETVPAIAKQYDGQASYGDLKKEVAGQVAEFLSDFQAKLAAVDEAALMAKLKTDEQQMNQIANATLLKVQQAVGLRA